MSTTAQTSSRVALQPISSSALNARLFTASFSTNLKAIIDRTPQLKRSVTVEVGALHSSKKFCNRDREPILPSPVSTPKLARSFNNTSRHTQASMLKARLQMAYYKIKHQKTQVPSKELLDSFSNGKLLDPDMTLQQQQQSGTPKKVKAKKTSTDLLASSTPIPVSIIKTGGQAGSNKVKSVSFKSTTRNSLMQTVAQLLGLRHPFLPQFNYTSSSPSKFLTTSLPASLTTTTTTTTTVENINNSKQSVGPKRTLKAPAVPLPQLKKSVKLPSLHEITSSMNTSTPLPKKHEVGNLISKDSFLTPVKANKKKRATSVHDDSTQLMSSPSSLMTTPSSMGAAKSLLQLAFDKK